MHVLLYYEVGIIRQAARAQSVSEVAVCVISRDPNTGCVGGGRHAFPKFQPQHPRITDIVVIVVVITVVAVVVVMDSEYCFCARVIRFATVTVASQYTNRTGLSMIMRNCRTEDFVVHDVLGFRHKLHDPHEHQHSHRVDDQTTAGQQYGRVCDRGGPVSQNRRTKPVVLQQHRFRTKTLGVPGRKCTVQLYYYSPFERLKRDVKN